MPPAPRLPPLLEGVDLAEPEAAPAAQAPTFAEPEAAPVAPLLAGAVEMLERVHRVHLDYLSGQSALHRQFLEQQARGQARLLAAMGVAEEQAPAALPVPPPVAPTGERGAAFTMDRAALAVHAGGQISTVFGPRFAEQDAYPRQCRMPEPPLLLADRVTDLVAEPASMGRGVVWTETDVRADSWYLHQGRMPTGILIESGQADLLLISYLGCDLLNRGERVYRLLGCDMTILGDLPSPGETLRYEIHVDGHARQGDVRLFFFHYDCTVNGVPRIRVRGGQAGFFTTEELAASAGILWDPATAVAAPDARLDPPAITGAPARYGPEALRAFAEGRPWECFGPAWAPCKAHVRTPNIQGGQMLFLEAVTAFEPTGGPWRRGYLRAETEIHPDDWYFAGHFKGDPCMPGTLMFEGSVQALSFTLAALGFTVERDGWRFQPVTGETVPMRCRGQVTPSSKRLVYEVFIEELISGPLPTVRADLLCTVDGLKAFHAKRFGLSLVPDWPLGAQPELLLTAPDPRAATLPNGHRFDQDALIASAIGRPSAAFGHGYARFDGPERAPRLPGPPYHFISRVTEIHGEFGSMQAGIRAVTEYDIPQGAWYLDDSGAMPFAVLLEAALQPCGWLATFVGCTLGAEQELFFRNLDGQLTLVGEPSRTLRPGQGPLTAELGLERLSRSAGMILVAFTVSLRVGPHPVGSMSTVFGFFPAAALANQAGLPCPPAERARLSAASAPVGEGALRRDGRLRLLDRVTGWWPEAGELRAEKAVDPLSWYFKAHFFQDPVQPGSLGVEAMLEALEAAHRLHFGLCGAPAGGYSLVPGSLSWRYRGQVRPGDGDVVITATGLTFGGDAERGWVRGGASLWIDGKRIYEASELGLAYQAPGPLGPGHSSVTTLPRFG
jgi:3-hydroxymyristoyl/3-hydroxydecanoyl-(acyl carrier protein) dehydratase